MGRMDGKVAFITGAARGQGRSHAVRLAEEGADIIAIDICEAIEGNGYPAATEADLEETVKQVEHLDRRIIAKKADIRNYGELKTVLDEAVAELGHLDVVVANAGIGGTQNLAADMPEEEFISMLDVNLVGTWRTAKAAIPHLMKARSGSIILTSSSLAVRAAPNLAHYVTAKHGMTGLMRSLALELAPHMIRVNTVNPSTVDTDMVNNPAMYALFMPDLPESERTGEVLEARFSTLNAMPIPWVEPRDVSNAVLFLASDEARYVTGTCMLIDAGCVLK